MEFQSYEPFRARASKIKSGATCMDFLRRIFDASFVQTKASDIVETMRRIDVDAFKVSIEKSLFFVFIVAPLGIFMAF